ncbi:serine/arginine repetitive matrix protein 1-like [Triticum dicoccoides]|uniref:serine/arginine repetitive matrix protein 1-like n=1 Tax=Triticum dicoccoides TaxID=85692 RepID=UPI00188E5FCA|nr:serine/arginine repetitive matrix protein 1-like [Triticum dicoccoides]
MSTRPRSGREGWCVLTAGLALFFAAVAPPSPRSRSRARCQHAPEATVRRLRSHPLRSSHHARHRPAAPPCIRALDRHPGPPLPRAPPLPYVAATAGPVSWVCAAPRPSPPRCRDGGPIRAAAPATSQQTRPITAATRFHAPAPAAPHHRPPRAASTPYISSARGRTPRARRLRPGRLRLRPRLCLPASTRPPHAGSGSPRRPGRLTPSPAPAQPLGCHAPRRLRLGAPPAGLVFNPALARGPHPAGSRVPCRLRSRAPAGSASPGRPRRHLARGFRAPACAASGSRTGPCVRPPPCPAGPRPRPPAGPSLAGFRHARCSNATDGCCMQKRKVNRMRKKRKRKCRKAGSRALPGSPGCSRCSATQKENQEKEDMSGCCSRDLPASPSGRPVRLPALTPGRLGARPGRSSASTPDRPGPLAGAPLEPPGGLEAASSGRHAPAIITSSFASSALNQSSSPGGSEATCGLRTRRRPQPAFSSPVSTSSTARPSVQLLQVARRLGGYTQCARAPPLSRRTPRPRPAGPCAPQPADSASASSALDVTVGFINNNEDPPPNFSKLPGGSEATSSGCARAPPLSRRTPRPRPAPSTSSSASSSTARPSTQIFQVARRLGGYTQWVRSRAPAQPADSVSAPGRALRPSAGGLRIHAQRPRHHRRLLQQRQDPPRNFSKLPGGSEATPSGCARMPPPETRRSCCTPVAGCNRHLLLHRRPLKTLRATFPSCPEAQRLLSGG